MLTFLLANMAAAAGAQQTTVYVFPESNTIPGVGLTFSVDVAIQNVNDLYGWEFKLFYPNDILNGTSVTEGPFLKAEGVPTFFYVAAFTSTYNETHGLVNVFCLRVDPDAPGVSGDGVLATITFCSTSLNGAKILCLADVKLSDSNVNEIPCITVNSQVKVIPEFPAGLMLPILIVSTLLAVALKKTAGKHLFAGLLCFLQIKSNQVNSAFTFVAS
jgi:hypothetical protein